MDDVVFEHVYDCMQAVDLARGSSLYFSETVTSCPAVPSRSAVPSHSAVPSGLAVPSRLARTWLFARITVASSFLPRHLPVNVSLAQLRHGGFELLPILLRSGQN